jgi:hypothetical protein
VAPAEPPALRRFRRAYGSGPIHLIATLAGFVVIGLALASLAAPGGATQAVGATGTISTRHASAMAGMDMSGLPPPIPKLAATSPCTATACPIPHPRPAELSVAGELGSSMAAAWITPAGHVLHVRFELLNLDLGPVREPTTFAGDPPRVPCGPGCWTLTLPGTERGLTIAAREDGKRYEVTLPLRYEHGQQPLARRLVNQAVGAMTALIGVRDEETTASGTPGTPGSFIDVHYLLSAPDALEGHASGYADRQVTIGPTQWTYVAGVGWLKGSYSGNGTGSFSTAALFDWDYDEQSAQLLGVTRSGGTRVAEIALMNPTVPAWLRLTMNMETGLVTHVRAVTQGKFTSDRYSDYGAAQRILPPTG